MKTLCADLGGTYDFARHPEDSVVLGLYSLFVHHVC